MTALGNGNDDLYDSLADTATEEDLAQIMAMLEEGTAPPPPADPRAPEWLAVLAALGPSGDVDEDKTRETLPRSDVTAARAFAGALGMELSYGRQTKQWRVWDGVVHSVDNEGRVERAVQRFCDAYRDVLDRVKASYQRRAEEARALAVASGGDGPAAYREVMKEYRDAWKEWRSFRNRLFQDAGQKALLSQLKVHCAFDDAQWDTEQGVVVFRNGVLVLRELFFEGIETVSLHGHDPKRRITMHVPWDWDPDARAPHWERYLETSLPDEEVREYLHKAAGYALTGAPNEKALFNAIGPSNSGKSVFLNVMLEAFGTYARHVPVKTFLQKHGDSDFDRDLLKGARLVTASEPGQGKRFDDDVLKSITGRDPQTTAAKFQQSTTWTPRCTIFIASNHAVKFDTTDGAFLRRVKPVTFPVAFVDSPAEPEATRMDPQLEPKIRREMEGVVAWLVEGLHRYFRDGLAEPDGVARARSEMQTELEPALEWAQEGLAEGFLRLTGPGEPASHGATISDLFSLYGVWEKKQGGGARPLGRKTFSKVLQSRYGKTAMSGGTRLPALAVDATRLDFDQQLALGS